MFRNGHNANWEDNVIQEEKRNLANKVAKNLSPYTTESLHGGVYHYR